jgi:hypothetical protein
VTETNVFQLSQPGTFADPLTEVLSNGARALLTQAVEQHKCLRASWVSQRRTKRRYQEEVAACVEHFTQARG